VSFRRAALALTAAVTTLVLAGTAAAAILPQRGIAGAKLLMTQAEVEAVLGEPGDVETGTNIFGPYTVFEYYRLAVTFQGDEQVSAVTTRRFSEKTPKGIGRGSTEAALRSAHPKAKCRTESPSFRHCWIGRFGAGQTVTDFRIRNGRVSRTTVAFVID
jgi:hypothetical protein